MALSPNDMLCFALYSATHAMQQAYRPLLRPLGLTYPQYLVLNALWTAKAAPSVSEISELVQLESNTLTPLLKRLEAMGLVRRKRDRIDERVVRIELTPAGRSLSRKATAIPAAIADRTGLALAEIERVRDEMNRLAQQLRSAAG